MPKKKRKIKVEKEAPGAVIEWTPGGTKVYVYKQARSTGPQHLTLDPPEEPGTEKVKIDPYLEGIMNRPKSEMS